MSDIKLKLYYKAECPYCQSVVRALDCFGVNCEMLPESTNSEAIQKLSGGSVPVLMVGEQVFAESSDIIQYLSKTYGENGVVPANSYGFTTEFNGNMQQAEEAITDALKEVGFGILTRIDVAATLKKKIDMDRPPYVILGACNPKIAGQAIGMEPDLGLLLPCNVVVRVNDAGVTEVAVVNPMQMLSVVGRHDMLDMALEVNTLMKQALAKISG
ncbi:MAG: DUF302 domain-containing protein [Ghiorsea sp.]